jgi:hypothetical protein
VPERRLAVAAQRDVDEILHDLARRRRRGLAKRAIRLQSNDRNDDKTSV